VTCLYSLLRHNPWFDARVIVLGDGLSEGTRASLARLYPVQFGAVDPALKSAAARLVRSGQLSRSAALRLHSLQLFGLSGLTRAVFLDVDTLCTGDVRPLFEHDAEFAAAPDLEQLQRQLRPERAARPYGRALEYSFNSGVMSVGGRWLTPEVYEDLLQLPGLAEAAGARELSDQYVLNRYFDGKVAPLDVRYNFLVPAEVLSRKLYRCELADVRILHYSGYSKPWQHTWEGARRQVPPRFVRHYESWHELRAELDAEATAEQALEQYRAGLAELSAAARQRDV
jgi:lipopolysaccharide biosynthesis glycosyltransferase